MSEVKRYTKRPVVVEAMLYDGTNAQDVIDWIAAANQPHCDAARSIVRNSLFIGTLEGDMRAEVGDYIIRGVAGEFYPCKPHIFAQTYAEAPADERD